MSNQKVWLITGASKGLGQALVKRCGRLSLIVANSFLSYDNTLPYWKNLLIKSYYNLKLLGVKEDVNFGLDKSNVVFERYPLVFGDSEKFNLQRI